jgi:DNA-binding HxlR family transcriptional regulator
MSKKAIQFRSACPISTALDIFGDKWSLLIIRDLMFNEKKTYGDFLNSEEKIATNILADRLAVLERNEIISRHSHPDSKAKVLYKLTPKGIDLVPVLVEVIAWSEKYHDVHPYARQFVKRLRKDKEVVMQGIREGLKGK